MDGLGYRMAVRPFEALGLRGQSYRRYAEWLVNGVPLVKLLVAGRPDRPDTGLDLLPAVSWGEASAGDVERLLLRRPADLPSGRHRPLVCPECGDAGCGVVSAVVERTEDAFVWRDFGREYDRDEEPPYLGPPYEGKGPFAFEPAAYERVLRDMQAIGIVLEPPNDAGNS